MLSAFLPLAFLLSPVVLAAPTTVEKRTTYPFTEVIGFGDNLSDNGNGMYTTPEPTKTL